MSRWYFLVYLVLLLLLQGTGDETLSENVPYSASKMKLAWTCMFTPRLYKIYRDGPKESVYQPQGLERWSDKVITSANMLYNISFYTSPFLCMYMFRRGFFSSSEAKFLMQCFGGFGCLLVICFVLRGIGRAFNPKYVEFVNALAHSPTEKNELLNAIRKFDFEAHAWPVTFTVTGSPILKIYDNPFKRCANPELPQYKRALIQVLAYLATHTFGLRLIYPGSVGLINHILWNALQQGRTHLVEEFDGKRAKIRTLDRNDIDTMFVDQRPAAKGRFLVICCEGNSGFYEIGLMTTPIKAGYSVLGWNHPGFAGSTGQPYPLQEENAIDAVMQYAINELGFQPEHIVMYGWSIGGYSATWASVAYPVRGLMLDATFDDLLPLAENQMPQSWGSLVKEVVRSHVNLNIGDLLVKYNGPVQMIRRTEDEIICLRPGHLKTNRGNDLLVRLVEHRHSSLPTEVRENLRRLVSLNESQRTALNYSTSDEHEQRALRLISTYMRDYKTTHCVPLSEQHFEAIIALVLTARGN